MVEKLHYNRYKITNCTKDNLQSLGFKKFYSEKDLYYYKFIVDKYNNNPTVWCKLTLDTTDYSVLVDLLRNDGSFFPAFYQDMSGFDSYIEKINNKIKRKLNKLNIKKVKNKYGRKNNINKSMRKL